MELSNNGSQDNTITDEFKKEIWVSVKKYGLLFPVTDEEVKLFEKLYGSTDVEMPEELKNSDDIFEWGEKHYGKTFVDEPLAMAARKGTNMNSKDLEKMKNLHEKAVKKMRKSKK